MIKTHRERDRRTMIDYNETTDIFSETPHQITLIRSYLMVFALHFQLHREIGIEESEETSIVGDSDVSEDNA